MQPFAKGDGGFPVVQHDAAREPVAKCVLELAETAKVGRAYRARRLDLDTRESRGAALDDDVHFRC